MKKSCELGLRTLIVLAGFSLVACGDDDPMGVDSGVAMDAGTTMDGAVEDAGESEDGGITEDGGTTEDGGADDGGMACMPRAAEDIPTPTGECTSTDGDFSPCTDDGYDACVSDSNTYVRVQDSISSIARVMAFERISDLLFEGVDGLEADDFLMGRMIYQEDEGLDSRIVRRYDPHFVAPELGGCTDEGVPAMFPDYCVGPAQIQPVILGAFQEGIAGTDMPANAGRVEGGLLWFLAVSVYKEATTCTTAAKDCDSSWAYYTGGVEERTGGIGFAGRVVAADPYSHDRVWDGLLAQRCWRDLDDAETAEDLTMRDLARGQTDRAVIDGAIAVFRARLADFDAAEGDAVAFHWGFLQTFGNFLMREAAERDEAAATSLMTELAKTDAATVDVGAMTTALDTIEECP